MLQGANTDLLSPFVPKAHDSESTISFINWASKSQLKLLWKFLFFGNIGLKKCLIKTA